jgi:hypothetical protein
MGKMGGVGLRFAAGDDENFCFTLKELAQNASHRAGGTEHIGRLDFCGRLMANWM